MSRARRAAVLAEAPEDHLTRSCLQDAGNRHVDVLSDHASRVVNNHHRPVVQVSNALVVFLTLLEHEDTHDLAGQHDRLQGVRKFVDIEDRNASKLRDLVQVEIVGDDLRFDLFGKLDQFVIDLAHIREVSLANDYFVARSLLLLNPLKNVESATAAIAFDRVGTVGYLLKLAQHELRYHQHAGKKACLGDVGHPAIDDDRSIEDQGVSLGRSLFYEYSSKRCQVQVITLDRADYQSYVTHEQGQREC